MEERKTAYCWNGARVWCARCGGPVRDLDDEYGSLEQGGSFERFECIDQKTPECRRIIYIELPD